MKIFQFKTFSDQKDIVHGISTRDFGSMKNADNTISRDNLEIFLNVLNVPKGGVCMGQVHSGNVEVISNSDKLLIENTDGLITNKKDIPLCVVTADCLPILLFDTKKQVIGVAHGGRRGLELGIIENVLKKLIQQFESNPRDIIVGIGPGIEKECYEVNGEFLDIRKKASDVLLEQGVLMENIENLEICTKDSNDLYSYRGGDETKRFVSVISLV